jgi:hypothetical protein
MYIAVSEHRSIVPHGELFQDDSVRELAGGGAAAEKEATAIPQALSAAIARREWRSASWVRVN